MFDRDRQDGAQMLLRGIDRRSGKLGDGRAAGLGERF